MQCKILFSISLRSFLLCHLLLFFIPSYPAVADAVQIAGLSIGVPCCSSLQQHAIMQFMQSKSSLIPGDALDVLACQPVQQQLLQLTLETASSLLPQVVFWLSDLCLDAMVGALLCL